VLLFPAHLQLLVILDPLPLSNWILFSKSTQSVGVGSVGDFVGAIGLAVGVGLVGATYKYVSVI
jgi:hypothetical protein